MDEDDNGAGSALRVCIGCTSSKSSLSSAMSTEKRFWSCSFEMRSHRCLIRSFNSPLNTLLVSFRRRVLFGVTPKIGDELAKKADMLVQGLLQLHAQVIKLLVIISCCDTSTQLLDSIL